MADVKRINGYDLNDDTSRTNIGCTEDTYDSSITYAVGDIVVYENKIYKCITAITTPEVFNSAKWQHICLRDLLIETRKNLNNKVVNSKNVDNKNEKTYAANIIDELIKRNIISVGLKTDQTTTNSREIVKLDRVAGQVGSDLTLAENSIVIGENINTIKISGALGTIWNSPLGVLGVIVAKNDADYYNFASSKENVNRASQAILPEVLIGVKKGDKIKIYINSDTTGVMLSTTRTFFAVEAVS